MVQKDKILLGECCAVMAKLPDTSVDMVFADPPYNLQLQNKLTRPDQSIVNGVDNQWDKFSTFKHYDSFTQNWLAQARRVLKPNGTLWVIGSYHNIFRIGATLQDMGFWILNDIIWRKTNPMPNFRGTRFANAHETLIWAAHSPKSQYVFNYTALKTLNDDLQMRSDDWLFSLCTGHERLKNTHGKKLHPTQKPEALVARTILAATNVGDVVLDPFLGTGTTAAAARMLGRNFIGIEMDKNYIQAAKTRLRRAKPQPENILQIMQSAKRATRIPFGRIVEERLINPGTKLYDKSQKFMAQIRADGSLISGQKTGSIHALAANLLESESCNGWTFWHYQQKRKLLTPIDQLRQEMRERLNSLSS